MAEADARAGACVLPSGRLRRGSLSAGSGMLAAAAAAQAASAASNARLEPPPLEEQSDEASSSDDESGGMLRELQDLCSPGPQETPPVATADADGRAGACVLTTGRLRRPGSLSVGAGAVAAAAQAAAAAQLRKTPLAAADSAPADSVPKSSRRRVAGKGHALRTIVAGTPHDSRP